MGARSSSPSSWTCTELDGDDEVALWDASSLEDEAELSPRSAILPHQREQQPRAKLRAIGFRARRFSYSRPEIMSGGGRRRRGANEKYGHRKALEKMGMLESGAETPTGQSSETGRYRAGAWVTEAVTSRLIQPVALFFSDVA